VSESMQHFILGTEVRTFHCEA